MFYHRLSYSCLVLSVVLCAVLALRVPPGCQLRNGEYHCDYRMCLPLSALDFEPPPQRLFVEEVYGTFTEHDFADFGQVNQSNFDANYDATLTIQCYQYGATGGLFTFNSSTFAGMDFYRSVQFVNCEFEYLIPGAFQNLRALNYLGFQGGYIDLVSPEAFHNLTIEPNVNATLPLGELYFNDVDLIAGGIANGVLDPLQNLAILKLVHSRVIVLPDDVFINLARVHTLYLDDNPLVYMKEDVFRNMTALSRVSLVQIEWKCTCTNMWFMTYFKKNGISLDSEVVCQSPASWEGLRATKFYEEICADSQCEQGTLPSVDLHVVCLTYLQIFIYCLGTFSFLYIIGLLYFCRKVRNEMMKAEGDMSEKGLRMMTPRAPPPRQRPPLGHERGPKAPKSWSTYAAGQSNV